MPAIPYLKKRIGQTYLVWFQNSNLYLQLEEPAWFVFRKTTKRYKAETIAKEFATRYGISKSKSLKFVRSVRSDAAKMNKVDDVPKLDNLVLETLDDHKFTPFSIHQYRLGDQLISFSYETHHFEHYLHPLISHFETEEIENEMPVFELFAHQDRIVFRFNGKVKGSWTKDETHLVKGLIFMFLINVIHKKTDADWLMTVHASAPPNHGKTTIAALLQTLGYQLISDDFVPIDRNSFNAYPFPIAMSVKQTSMELLSSLYPALEQKTLNYISPEKSVRFLPAKHQIDVYRAIYPVHEFIFIHYDKSVDFILEKLDPIKAIKLLLDQAWVTPTKGNATLLFEWITQISFYKLTYSNNQKALETITNLFDHD